MGSFSPCFMSIAGRMFGVSLADYLDSAKSRKVTKVDVAVYEEKEEDWENHNQCAVFFEEQDGRRSLFSDRLSVDHQLFCNHLTASKVSYNAAVYLRNNGIPAAVNGQSVDERLVRAKG